MRALLRICLLAWPRRERRLRGPGLIDTAVEVAMEGRRDGVAAFLRALFGEAGGLVTSGVGLRWATLRLEMSGWGLGWTRDARFAIRTLGRSPGFTSAAIVSLALGIGANAAIFSLVDGVLLRPLPYDRPDELTLVWNTLPDSHERIPVAGPDAAVVAERATRLADVAFTIRGVDGSVETAPEAAAVHVRLAAVTENFFEVLGASPALGRVFDSSDGPSESGAEGGLTAPVIVLADRLWRTVFGADPGVLGREIHLNGIAGVVIGIMPPHFRLALPPDAGVTTDVDVWVPLGVPLTAFHREERLLDQDSDNTGVIVARLAPGADLVQAREELGRIGAELRSEVPKYATAGLGFDVRALHADATEHARPLLVALLAGVGAVLLVACLNIGTLLLARGMMRSREFAVRASLGAGRARLIRLLLIEGAVLVAVGLAAALVLAQMALPALSSLVPPELAPPDGLSLDFRTLGFAALLAAAAVILFGIVPGLQAGAIEARGVVGAGIVRGGGARRRGQNALVVAEVACSVVLVLSAGLLLRTVFALQAVHPGFQADHALTFQVSLRIPETYRSPAYRAQFMKEIESGLQAVPGVQAVGLVGVLPLGGDRWTQPYGLPGQPESEWRANRADYRVVTSGYFDAIGARVLEGRGFTPEEDVAEIERVVVVDEKLARRIAPNGSALNAVVGVPVDGAAVEARVVGVVENIRYERLDAVGREAIYVPYRQEASRDVSFVVRTSGDPESAVDHVRRTVRSLDPDIPVYALRTLDDYVAGAVAPRRFAFVLLVAFAVLALLCSTVGLYGVMALDVGRRTHDIGLRMAIGADRRAVVRSVMRDALKLGGLGLGLGLVLAAATARSLRGLVYGIGVADPITWTTVVVLVLVVIVAAALPPALRASRLSPTLALQAE